jgi:hypothetical protein
MKWIISMIFFILAITYVIFLMSVHRDQPCNAKYEYPFQDPTLPTDVRLDNLMSLLTTTEKVIASLSLQYSQSHR